MMRDYLKGKDRSADVWQPFTVDLTHGGQPAGQLKGELKITWDAVAYQAQ